MLCSQDYRLRIQPRKTPLMKRDKKWISSLGNIDLEAWEALFDTEWTQDGIAGNKVVDVTSRVAGGGRRGARLQPGCRR